MEFGKVSIGPIIYVPINTKSLIISSIDLREKYQKNLKLIASIPIQS